MVAIILHLYYQDLWEELKEKIIPLLNETTHLFITVNKESEYTNDMMQYSKKIFILENRGMDFGPFVYVWNEIKNDGYDYILKLHGKKSEEYKTGEQLHSVMHDMDFGKAWRTNLVNALIDTNDKFYEILNFMRDNANVYMAGSKYYFYDTHREGINNICRKNCEKNINKLLEHVSSKEHGCFFAGSMFLVKSDYLKKFFKDCDLIKLYEEFEDYYSNDSDLLAHAMERVIGYGVEKHDGKFLIV